MRINIVLTGTSRGRSTAGHEMLFRYANGLIDCGHQVRIVPTGLSQRPEWFDLRAEFVEPVDPGLAASLLAAARRYAQFRLGSRDKSGARDAVSDLTRRLAVRSSLPYRQAAGIERIHRALPDADITMASGAPTAIPVYLYGTGTKVYFMQGYESWFELESEPHWQRMAELEAEMSYKLPLHRIANSSWLADLVRERHGGEVELCLNALDHDAFRPRGSTPCGPFTVVSYSGRGAALKGFAQAAEAIRLARERLGAVRWMVFGHDGELPPENRIAPYEALGVLDGRALSKVYSSAHAALCPAWHDSFPMYPLEAMACGCAVVTTPHGVEDYAEHERNALIVPVRDSQAMAAALVRLHDDRLLRDGLTERGLEDAQRFTWDRSLRRMEHLLQAFRRESATRSPKAVAA